MHQIKANLNIMEAHMQKTKQNKKARRTNQILAVAIAPPVLMTPRF
jgi:hypothetical protein